MSTSVEHYDVVNPSPTNAGHPGRHHRPLSIDESPSTPEMSHLSTPKMSQHNARSVVLETPPLILDTFPSPKPHLQSAPSIYSDHTPTSLDDDDDDQYRFDTLEPPAWRPPERDELDYVESWNMMHNNPHHYLNGYSYNTKDDSSTICSSQTGNNSLGKSYSSSDNRSQHMQILRPRGFSITSNSYGSHNNKGHTHSRHLSFGSCPQQPLPRCGPSQHHRHESLPVALFSSSTLAQSSQSFLQSQHQQNPHNPHQHHPLLAQQPKEHEQQQTQARMNQRTYQMIQPRKRNGPYERHSRQHVSQIRADATMAGLRGALIDLYAIDRCVDEATARMLATTPSDEGRKKGSGKYVVETMPSRLTSVGTLKDIQIILELRKVDRMVDRFKQGLQMPVFFEEEAMDSAILKQLRRVDLLIEGCHQRNDKDVARTTNGEEGLNQHQNKKQEQYQFDLSDGEDEEESWNLVGGGYGDDIYLPSDPFGTVPDRDPYQFYDPHEQAVVLSNTYQQSYALATSEDDLNEIMDLLRSDVEIDGASRSRKELEMVRPLLEIDRSVERWRRWTEKKKCENDLMELYLVDVEVDGAKRRAGSGTRKGDPVELTVIKLEDNRMEEKFEVSLGSSQNAESFEENSTVNTSEGSSDIAVSFEQITKQTQTPCLNPPIAAPSPLSVTTECTKRSIFPHREKINASMLAATDNATSAQAAESSKRSIFTLKEKAAALKGSFQAQGG